MLLVMLHYEVGIRAMGATHFNKCDGEEIKNNHQY